MSDVSAEHRRQADEFLIATGHADKLDWVPPARRPLQVRHMPQQQQQQQATRPQTSGNAPASQPAPGG